MACVHVDEHRKTRKFVQLFEYSPTIRGKGRAVTVHGIKRSIEPLDIAKGEIDEKVNIVIRVIIYTCVRPMNSSYAIYISRYQIVTRATATSREWIEYSNARSWRNKGNSRTPFVRYRVKYIHKTAGLMPRVRDVAGAWHVVGHELAIQPCRTTRTEKGWRKTWGRKGKLAFHKWTSDRCR